MAMPFEPKPWITIIYVVYVARSTHRTTPTKIIISARTINPLTTTRKDYFSHLLLPACQGGSDMVDPGYRAPPPRPPERQLTKNCP